MAYTKTDWANGTTPAINAANLNKIENELETLDNGLTQVQEGIGDKQDEITSNSELQIGKIELAKTSYNYNGGAIPGTKVAIANTIPGLLDELRFTNGQMGSVQVATEYTKDSITIGTGWYLYHYIPHRIGGENGQAPETDGDNVKYGVLLLYGMTANRGLEFKITINGSGDSYTIYNLISPNIYVTNDQPIGKWIDGRTLYRKIIQFTPGAQNGQISHGISNLYQVVRVGGMFQRGTATTFNPLPNNYTNWEAYIYDFSASAFTYRFSDNQWNAGVGQCFIFIEFTK